MKVTIEYNLPDEAAELKDALESQEMSAEIWRFYNYLRSVLKHNPENLCDDKLLGYEAVMEIYCKRFADWLL